jgi:hypothetical protein
LLRKSDDSGDRVVTGKELATCFDELKASLGISVIETIVYELEIMFGIMLEGRMSYKMSRIDDALRKLLGDSAAELMMEHIRASLAGR